MRLMSYRKRGLKKIGFLKEVKKEKIGKSQQGG